MATNRMTDVLGRERYQIDRPLGVGAMGTVLLARDSVLGRVVAVKVLADHLAADDDFRDRFLRESRLAARLCHPHIVQVFDAGEDGGCPYLVMEYVEGETVAGRLAAGRPFSAASLARLGAQLAAGLAHAHARGVVHRDVKPHNVLVRQDGTAKLTDFGIARAVEERGLTEIGTVLGTAPYMAPEQAAGRPAGPAADIYALGALLRHCAAGALPDELAGVVDAAMAEDPAARPPATEVHRRLLALAEEPALVPPPAPVGCAEAAPTVVAPGPAGVAAPTMVAAGSPAVAAPTVVAPAPPDAGATEVSSAPGDASPRPFPGAALLPPAVRDWIAERHAAPVIAAAVLAVLLAVATHHPAGSAEKPAASTSTSATAPAPEAAVIPVPPGADPAQAAHNLADWLRGRAK